MIELRLSRSLAGTDTVRDLERIFENMLAQTSRRFQTASSIMSFIVATLVRPEIQTMAQEELDAVTERVRLPTFEDRPRLPFVDAICKEVLRWRPVSPIGEFTTRLSQHEGMTTIDRFSTLDVYRGFFIPKG